MTRINILNPAIIADQHLLAEHHEILRIGTHLQKSMLSPSWSPSRIPPTFRLGTGHVMFFYDKGEYIHKRWLAIRKELTARGYTLSPKVFLREQFPDRYYNDWTPTAEAKQIIWRRISEKIRQKPEYYTIRGVPITSSVALYQFFTEEGKVI